jgi:hypothetical protein
MSLASHLPPLFPLSLRVVLIAIVTFGCSRQSDVRSRLDSGAATPSNQGDAATRLCRATDTVYFADTPLADREGWYGKHLRAMREPVFCPEGGSERYRFLWLRTFHRPIAVRVEQRGDEFRVVAKELDGAGGYEPGKMVRDTSFSLPRSQWAEFRRLLADAKFWQVPTHWAPEEGVVGLDGAQWILEGVAGDDYHVVDRWTPDQDLRDAAFRRAAIFLLSISTVRPPDTEIY